MDKEYVLDFLWGKFYMNNCLFMLADLSLGEPPSIKKVMRANSEPLGCSWKTEFVLR